MSHLLFQSSHDLHPVSYTHLELGRDAAEKIYERHCFLTNYLISIGVAPATAEADACRIEHDISAETYERLKESVTKE